MTGMVTVELPDHDLENGNKKHATATTTTTETTTTTTNASWPSCSSGCWSAKRALVIRRLPQFVRALSVTVALFVIVGLIWNYMGWIYGIQAIGVALIALLIASGGWRWIYIAAVTGPRDIVALIRYFKLLFIVRKQNRQKSTVADIFEEHVARTPDKPCLVFEEREWTFREVNEFANRIANVFKANGFKKGDIVALFMENRPEFVCIWLGLSKIGVIVPLINTNQRNASLLHSIKVANCNGLIYGDQLIDAIEEIQSSLPSNLALYQFNVDQRPLMLPAKDLAKLAAAASNELQPTNADSVDKVTPQDILLYIYTSGTTGLPKAAVISHSRFVFIVAGIHVMVPFRQDDIFYTPLPLYHTAGGVMSIGQALIFGATVVIRRKFSASGYFPDCQKYKCTVGQYIGEMCRYMLATPAALSDRTHSLRLVFGNGLRPQIWPQFVERFNIKQVGEFYGATEGNANIINVDNTIGSIGFISRIIPSVYPISIIKADLITGEPVRGPNGLCQLCEPNEAGVFIGKIIPGNPARAFLGYVDKQASTKKIVHDIFKKGDSAFLSGDLLTYDERGYLYFKDRTGDTFRWKGENVSTSEVEAQVSNEAGYKDAVAYGVEVPNMEGRAGMAAILDPDNTLDLAKFSVGIKSALPPYARPQFIRLLTKVDMTGTFKLKKLDLQTEGFDPQQITDTLYYYTANGIYEPLTVEIYSKICNGEIRL